MSKNNFDKSLLRITESSFATAKNLERQIGKALSASNLQLDVSGINTENLTESNISENTLGQIIKSMLNVVTSESVEKACFKCAERALYNGAKVDEDFFEDPKNRYLYYPIMIEVIQANISPFLEGLFSRFGDLTKLIGLGQK